MATSILVALDLSPESQQVIEKAKEIAAQSGAAISVIHVVEPVITDSNYVLPDVYVDLEAALVDRAEKFLADLLKRNGLNSVAVFVEVGSIKGQIFQKIEQEKVDLIVMGTHGRHGIARLLGSTASAVLHGTPCDIYMVRVH
ncbi:MAG: universal stress protein [Gammaproteobacteria bacterium]|nr:universal stress protein [Gammaproteobacteria bacterium]